MPRSFNYVLHDSKLYDLEKLGHYILVSWPLSRQLGHIDGTILIYLQDNVIKRMDPMVDGTKVYTPAVATLLHACKKSVFGIAAFYPIAFKTSTSLGAGWTEICNVLAKMKKFVLATFPFDKLDARLREMAYPGNWKNAHLLEPAELVTLMRGGQCDPCHRIGQVTDTSHFWPGPLLHSKKPANAKEFTKVQKTWVPTIYTRLFDTLHMCADVHVLEIPPMFVDAVEYALESVDNTVVLVPECLSEMQVEYLRSYPGVDSVHLLDDIPAELESSQVMVFMCSLIPVSQWPELLENICDADRIVFSGSPFLLPTSGLGCVFHELFVWSSSKSEIAGKFSHDCYFYNKIHGLPRYDKDKYDADQDMVLPDSVSFHALARAMFFTVGTVFIKLSDRVLVPQCLPVLLKGEKSVFDVFVAERPGIPQFLYGKIKANGKLKIFQSEPSAPDVTWKIVETT